jgi:hypothetical protein
MKEKIKNIIAELQEVVLEMQLVNISSENLLNRSIDIYLKQMEEENKNQRTNQIQNQNNGNGATPKQKSFLKSLGYVGDLDILTKDEAKKLIESHLEKQKLYEG